MFFCSSYVVLLSCFVLWVLRFCVRCECWLACFVVCVVDVVVLGGVFVFGVCVRCYCCVVCLFVCYCVCVVVVVLCACFVFCLERVLVFCVSFGFALFRT